ncbi:MAG TPA: nitrous oxide reductase family maturation protein NosD [Cerasibacillus sp.]|uniref:nitrous oxide reductase family maturation protein NosD n=1 Tax=Cerasibacillus sp. TaxID=2498711 RepID=UPI002F4255D3
MKRAIIGAILTVLICIGIHPVSAQANELQKHIKHTPKNGVLELDAKIYKGNVVIDKPLTIIGKKGTKIYGDKSGNVIEIRSDDVTLDQLEIKYSGLSRSSKEEYSGVRVMGNSATLTNLSISDSYHGIYLNRTENNVIKNNTIVGFGAEVLGDQGYGIYINRAGNNELESNYIEKTRDGIYVEYANNNEIRNNTATKTRYGLHYMYSNYNTFEGNHFNQNVGGAAIMHSDHITLKNNTFSYNQGSRAFGLIIQTSRDIHVLKNEFHLNQRGLYVEQSTSNLIEQNEFYNNQVGVEVWASATAHVFTKNTFHSNHTNVLAVGGESNNEWFKNGVGNYWDTPMLDLDNDGISDMGLEQTSTLSQLVEANELAYLFLDSPAITIFEKANELLSNEEVMAFDQHPLMPENRLKSSAIIWIIVAGSMMGLFVYFNKRGQLSWRIFGRKD